MKTLVLTDQQQAQIQRESADAYPSECCGIIYGIENQTERRVSSLEPVANVFDEIERYHRFSISTKQLMQAERNASDRGELVVGFYHSHPDHPARPSEYDREHAWPFYSYVIIAVVKAKPDLMTCWMLNEQTEQFEQQEISAEEHA